MGKREDPKAGNANVWTDDEKSESSSESREYDDHTGVDPDLLAVVSEDSTDTEEEEELREVSPVMPSRDSDAWETKRRLKIADTIITVVIGLWVIRVPVLNIDIES